MTRPADRRLRSGSRLTAGVVSLAVALSLATIALPALGATAPTHGTTHSSRTSHHGNCARHARRHKRRHRHCSAVRRGVIKAPVATAPALAAPYGPVAQPGALVAALPAPAAPAASGPASEGAPPVPGGGETGETSEPPSVPHVQVSAVEYAFTLSRTTVPAGKVVFQFVNNGQDEHNLQIAPPEGPLAGSFANTPSKGIGDLTLEMQPGTYTLLCSLPTHEQKGMKATLTVE
jgi:plastocyanin